MRMDERLSKTGRVPQIQVSKSCSMNLAPPNEFSYGKEEDRVTIRFRPDDDEDDRRLVVRMSRKEAKALGERLVRYGNMILDSEKEAAQTA